MARFPQFQDGVKAEKETALRLNKVAALKAYDKEAIARERAALKRSRALLSRTRDPLALRASPDPSAARAASKKSPVRKKKRAPKKGA